MFSTDFPQILRFKDKTQQILTNLFLRTPFTPHGSGGVFHEWPHGGATEESAPKNKLARPLVHNTKTHLEMLFAAIYRTNGANFFFFLVSVSFLGSKTLTQHPLTRSVQMFQPHFTVFILRWSLFGDRMNKLHRWRGEEATGGPSGKEINEFIIAEEESGCASWGSCCSANVSRTSLLCSGWRIWDLKSDGGCEFKGGFWRGWCRWGFEVWGYVLM